MSELSTIILADGSRLLREMLRRVIEKTKGLRVVAEVEQLDRLADQVETHHPDWVIFFQPSIEETPDSIEHLLRDNQDMRIAVLSSNGDRVRMKWLEYHDEALQNLTWEALTRSLIEKKGADWHERS
ncbi:MAG: hypothetical protein JXB85_01555 [Anaerolineales bacterium]|nr:hypothetical protein [Anaerolineales bacterium]